MRDIRVKFKGVIPVKRVAQNGDPDGLYRNSFSFVTGVRLTVCVSRMLSPVAGNTLPCAGGALYLFFAKKR